MCVYGCLGFKSFSISELLFLVFIGGQHLVLSVNPEFQYEGQYTHLKVMDVTHLSNNNNLSSLDLRYSFKSDRVHGTLNLAFDI